MDHDIASTEPRDASRLRSTVIPNNCTVNLQRGYVKRIVHEERNVGCNDAEATSVASRLNHLLDCQVFVSIDGDGMQHWPLLTWHMMVVTFRVGVLCALCMLYVLVCFVLERREERNIFLSLCWNQISKVLTLMTS